MSDPENYYQISDFQNEEMAQFYMKDGRFTAKIGGREFDVLKALLALERFDAEYTEKS